MNFNPFKIKSDVYMSTIKGVIIGSPGTYNKQLFDYLKDIATKDKIEWLQHLLDITTCQHTSNGYKQAMLELMSNEGVKDSIKGLTCFSETKHLHEFFEVLRTKDD